MSEPTASQDPLGGWVRRISEEEMPVFGRTAQGLGCLVADELSHRNQLCNVILQDAAMTARVLRLANTVFYNPTGQSMSSISRAVVVLGINGIRTLCLTVALVDSLSKGALRDRAASEMARAFLAATLARNVAAERGDPAPEEIFVAALLYRLGDMAFWCFGGEVAEALDERLKRGDITKEKAEREVLGFPLMQLTEQLASNWNLSELLVSTLRDRHNDNPRMHSVLVANQFANNPTASLDDPAAAKLLKEIAKLAGATVEATLELVGECANEAATTARELGAPIPAIVVPPAAKAAKTAAKPAAAAPRAPEPSPEPFEQIDPNPMLQLKILREMTQLSEERADFNHVLEVALEGIYRGIGMDRALFTLLTPDRKILRGKVALGADRTVLAERFQIPANVRGNAFIEVLETREGIWVKEASLAIHLRTIPEELRPLITGPMFVAAVVVNNRSIGVLYADRQRSGRPLDEESFAAFRHFTQQANVTLDAITRRPR